MERVLDIPHGTAHLQHLMVGARFFNHQVCRTDKIQKGLNILNRGTVISGKLLGCQVMPIKGALGILNFFEGVIKRGGVSQRQGEEES